MTVPSLDYAGSHAIVRLSSKRFAMSPWMPAYLTDDAVLGVYSRRFYALGVGDDPAGDYWRLRRGAALYDVPEHPVEIVGPRRPRPARPRVVPRHLDGRGPAARPTPSPATNGAAC